MKHIKRIILIRHGQSEANTRSVGGKVEGLYVNDCEVKLTEHGKEQAILIANSLLQKFKSFDVDNTELWVSPYTRTRQTAEIINSILSLKHMYEDPRISEQDFGDFDYQFMDDWKTISAHSYFVNQMRYNSRHARFWARLEGGESLSDVYNRVSLFDVSRCQNNQNTQILVTHGCFIKAALMYFTGASVEFIYDFENDVPNCSAYILEKHEFNSCYDLKMRIVPETI